MTKLLQKLVTFSSNVQNSTSFQSWHSPAHAWTSSWLTNAERDAPVASVKVVVSASCLRGKRPSASSKLLRYLESQPNQALSISGFFKAWLWIKHKSEVIHCFIPFLLELSKNETTHRARKTILKKRNNTPSKKDYASWKLCLFFILHPILFVSLDLCRLDSSGDPHSALMSLMSESTRKPAKPAGSLRS